MPDIESNLLTFIGYVRRELAAALPDVDIEELSGLAKERTYGSRPVIHVGGVGVSPAVADEPHDWSGTRIGRLHFAAHVIVGLSGNNEAPDPYDMALATAGSVAALVGNGAFQRATDTVKAAYGRSSFDGIMPIVGDSRMGNVRYAVREVQFVVEFSVAVKLDILFLPQDGRTAVASPITDVRVSLEVNT